MDPLNEDFEVAHYVAGSLVSSTRSCISVACRHYVDGDVTLRLANDSSEFKDFTYHQIFEGSIYAPNRKVAVVTPELDIILETAVETAEARIIVWADETIHPSTISIAAR